MHKSSFILLLAVVISGKLLSQIPTNGIGGYWPFNGNPDDESNNGNHGFNYGAFLAPGRFDQIDQAYYFDGTESYIDCYNGLKIDDKVTVCVWLKMDDTIQRPMHIINRYFESFMKSGFMLHLADSGKVVFSLGTTSLAGGFSSDTVNKRINDNQWHFVVATCRPNVKEVWIDGYRKLLVNGIETVLSTNNNYHLCFGKRYMGNQYHYHGLLDDIRIYNRMLTGSEIRALYNEIPVHISSDGQNEPWCIFPNPCHDYIIVSMNEHQLLNRNYWVKIYSAEGKEQMLSGLNQLNTQLNVNHLKTGLYILHILNSDNKIVASQKLLIN